MNRIISPLETGMRGSAVGDLQDALKLFLERGTIEGATRAVLAGLQRERAEQTYGDYTGRLVHLFQEQRRLEATGRVDETTARAMNAVLAEWGLLEEPIPENPCVVRGRVLSADGQPLPGLMASAFARGLRGETPLGTARTDREGHYLINYRSAQPSRRNGGVALIVRAYDPNDPDKVVAESPLLASAPAETELDLVIADRSYRGPAECQRIGEHIDPLLDGLDPADLDAGQVVLLAARTGIEQTHLAYYARAARLARETDIPKEILYGLFRQNLPVDLPGLLAQDPALRRGALRAAVEANLISGSAVTDERLDAVRRVEERAAASILLDRPVTRQRASLRALLATVIEDRELQQTFAARYSESRDPTAFWERVQEEPGLRDHAAELRFAHELGALTGAHLPLVKALQRRRRAGEFSSVQDLARKNEADWEQMIRQPGIAVPEDVPGADAADKARTYARAIAHLLEDAFPTTFIAARIAESELEDKADLGQFLVANADFRIEGPRLETYLATNPRALDPIPPQQRDTVIARVKGLQRLRRLTPRANQMLPLLKDGLDSAHAITRLGPAVLQSRYAKVLGNSAAPWEIYEQAEQVAGTAINLLTDYGLGSSKVDVKALLDSRAPADAGTPDWRALFGSLDLCECEHCRSVYSPAAYLVDILHFLKDRQLVAPKGITLRDEVQPDGSSIKVIDKVVFQDKSAADVLLGRRPDLQEIELTCENTNIPVPYVDLVREILEEAIAPLPPFAPFALPANNRAQLEAALNQAEVSDALAAAFETGGQPKLDKSFARITVKKPGKWWVIDDLACSYTVRKENTDQALHVVTRGRQTKGDAPERAANPQYLHQAAYLKLARQVAPLGHYNRLSLAAVPTSLPFNPWLEETRAYLRHLGVQRHELMEALLPGDRTKILADSAIAHEYLGLAPEEAALVNGQVSGQPGANDPGQWNLWGFNSQDLSRPTAIPDPANSTQWISSTTDDPNDRDWLHILTERVDVFLQQSGLRYTELLALLGCYTVNPLVGGARRITVRSRKDSDEDTCDLSLLRLDGFDATAAERSARFIRLWRKLGWTMRDLDHVLTALGAAQLDDKVLTQVSHLARLHKALKLPANRLAAWSAAQLAEPQLLSWWSATYVDHEASGQPVQPSLYERLFRDKAVTNPLDPAFSANPAQIQATETLTGHAATITAALGISAADFALLLHDTAVVPRSQADPIQPDDTLRLRSLAELDRHAGLAKALRLPIRDYLTLLKLMCVQPFASTVTTVRFVERVERLRNSGFTIAELVYLLRHEFTSASGIALSEGQIGLVLSDIRSGLQAIAAETMFAAKSGGALPATVDTTGELTRQKLAQLNWDAALIDQAINMLNDTAVYEADLAMAPAGPLPNDTGVYAVDLVALPAGYHIPATLQGIVYYDAAAQQLRSARALTPAERSALLKNAPVGLAPTLQKLLQQPEELHGAIAYDTKTRKLRFAGAMNKARLARLQEALPNDNGYQTALQKLYDQPRDFTELYMRVFGAPARDFSVKLPGSVVGISFPDSLKNVYYDEITHTLHVIGILTEAQRTTLLDVAKLPGGSPFRKTINDLHTRGKISQAEQNLLLGLANHADYRNAVQQLHINGTLSRLQFKQVRDLVNDADYQKAIKELYDAPRNVQPLANDESITSNDRAALFDSLLAPEQRYAMVLDRLLPHLRRTLSERLVKQKLADALELEAEATDKLLTAWIGSVDTQSPKRAISDFLDPDFAESSAQAFPAAAEFPKPFKSYVRLHKIALVVTTCKLTATQLAWLFDCNGPQVHWLDLRELPLTASEPAKAAALFTRWEKLVDLVRLRDALPAGERLLATLFTHIWSAQSEVDDVLEALCAETQWDLTDAKALIGQNGFSYTFPDDYQDGQALLRVTEAFALLKRLGMSAAQSQILASVHQHSLLLDGQQPLLDEKKSQTRAEALRATAQSVVQATRAKYDEPQWLAIVRPLRDVLREQQRAALVTYLVANPRPIGQFPFTRPAWRDVNDLFAYFLIDVEMSPCQLTSRIKQASGAVQLFVQRCLMNLEPEVMTGAAFDPRWREWSWMKNYRVWEANRKVFLYPENWIEPELRDDKSPFFKELESELLQGDLSRTPDETDIQTGAIDPLENAFRHYLEKLDVVARLEIVGMYHQEEKDHHDKLVVDLLHVFGRTPNTPHTYYYRRRVDAAYWTAWEKVDLDIEGDHLIPVVWNRRLYLFWAIFTEKQDEIPLVMPDAGKEVKQGEKFWDITFAWSEYVGGKFAIKQIANQSLATKFLSTWGSIYERKSFSFHATPVQGELIVACYWASDMMGESFSKVHAGDATKWATLYGIFRFTGCSGRTYVAAQENSTIYSGAPIDSHFENMMVVQDSVELVWLGRLSVLPGESQFSIPLLENTSSLFKLLPPHQYRQFTAEYPFFYQDDNRTFFVSRETDRISLYLQMVDPVWSEKLLKPYIEDAMPEGMLGPLPPIALQEDAPSRTDDPLAFKPSFPVANKVPAPVTPQGFSPTITHDIATDLVPALWSGGTNLAARQHALSATSLPSFSDSVSMLDTVLNSFESVEVPIGWLYKSGYRFHAFYHPYVCNLIRHLNRDGIAGLMQRPLQLLSHRFFDSYGPTDLVLTGEPATDDPAPKYPRNEVDFSFGGAYSLYNWELFFHAPLLIADRLSKDQQFAAAQKWFHFIFDPTDRSTYDSPQRFWQTRPFFETTSDDYWSQSIRNMLLFLAGGVNPKRFAELAKRVQDDLLELPHKIEEWRKQPFRPHAIARLRTTAYQKTVVMKYLDNLIAWGDQLFRRDTIESINEATQLYLLAAEILGPRPERIPPRAEPEVQTFQTIAPKLDAFSGALVAIEDFVPPSAPGTMPTASQPHVTLPAMLYFGVPKNDKLLTYWDTVADRLFKVRHCMNIEGVVRQLPLFEPPIEPGLLVKAVAAGIDISSALNDINAALPYYRFQVMAQKAAELCAEVKALGGALLAALEKRDAEELALLRSSHEIAVLKAVRLVKDKQIQEASEALEGLKKSKELIAIRRDYYAGIAFMNAGEQEHLNLLETGLVMQTAQAEMDYLGNALSLVPETKAGSPTTMGTEFGGRELGGAIKAMAAYMGSLVSMNSTIASMSATLGGHQRRWDDWKLQERIATKELEQIDKQIAAAEIRQKIAEQELTNHDRQIENAEKVDATMRDKFTNRELYAWMVGQISGIYFQSYQLAYDIAKRTERAFRNELGLADSSFIQFGYWDSLKKGLMAGERLHRDLKRMEVAYLEQNRREYEITKHVSLLQINPLALIRLRGIGECEISLPETLFDQDCPGHYLRRIKSVSVSIPCVAGPYTGVHCTLTLFKSSIRHSSTLSGDRYARDPEKEDSRFSDSFGSIQSIVTSSGQNDSGLFETNLRDERYLPFEGCGVISEWRIALPKDFRQFDYDTISDVILHIRYTAREGGDPLREGAIDRFKQLVNDAQAAGCARLFSIRHEFPTEWTRFQNQTPKEGQRYELALKLRQEHYPFWSQGCLNKVTRVDILVRPIDPIATSVVVYDQVNDKNPVTGDPQPAKTKTLEMDPALGKLLTGSLSGQAGEIALPKKPDEGFKLYFGNKEIQDLCIAITWSSQK